MDVVYRQMVGTVPERAREWTDGMDERPKSNHRSIRRSRWVNAVVLLLLLSGALLGITQMFILLAIYALVIAPA